MGIQTMPGEDKEPLGLTLGIYAAGTALLTGLVIGAYYIGPRNWAIFLMVAMPGSFVLATLWALKRRNPFLGIGFTLFALFFAWAVQANAADWLQAIDKIERLSR